MIRPRFRRNSREIERFPSTLRPDPGSPPGAPPSGPVPGPPSAYVPFPRSPSKTTILAVLFVWATLVGCTERGEPGAGQDGPSITVALEGSPKVLDPRYALGAHEVRINSLIYNSLVCLDRRSRVAPDLATHWETPDPVTYIFHLRRGVLFHDGVELTSEDVRYTFESGGDPDRGGLWGYWMDRVVAMETPDRYTVVFRLTEPFAPFLMKLAKGIVPRHLAEPLGKAFADSPVGTGPFRFVEFAPGERIRLAAFTDYFEGAPRIEEVLFRVITNQTTRMLELKRGTVDLLQNALPPYAIKFFERQPGLRILEEPGINYSYLGFNLDHPILGVREVRAAIAHAIDREAIIGHSWKGLATPATGFFSSRLAFYEGDVETYPFDPARAKTLLDGAGFPDPDGDGPRMRFTVSYKTSTDKLRNEIAEIIRDQLRRVGIGIEKRSYEWGTFFDDIKKGNFEMYSLTWVGMSDPDALYWVFHSTMIPPNGANRGRYDNPEVDRLLERSRVTLDEAERNRMYGEIQKILARDLVYVSLYHHTDVVAIKQGVEGYEIFPTGEFRSLKRVWFRHKGTEAQRHKGGEGRQGGASGNGHSHSVPGA